MYYYKTPVGTFSIRPDNQHLCGVTLFINDEPLGNYDYAFKAADDVFTRHTKHAPWDKNNYSRPKGLSDWKIGTSPGK